MNWTDPRMGGLVAFAIMFMLVSVIAIRPLLYKLDLMLTIWFTRRKIMQRAIDEVWPGNSLSSFRMMYRHYSAEQLEEILDADYERHKEMVESQRLFTIFH